ncbi:MAG: hypothetical protein CBD82_04355 [Gammaproteobacteria bacterium TMED222]|nr:MAG: hypothetical protein CBD82_04355 [Gammaproteobacteria bacterium TMED222]
MANIHVLVKQQDASGKGWLESYYGYGAYGVYRIADEHQDMRLDLDSIGAETLTAAEAKSAIFSDAYRGYVKIKTGNAITDDFPEIESDEDVPSSTRYDLTADDIASGLSFNKILFKKYIRDRFNDKAKDIVSARVGDLEQLSFEQQKDEAAAWTADNTASTPMLTTMATARGITVSALVSKINTKVAAYNSAVATKLAEQKVLEDEVDALDTIAKAHKWRHEKLGLTASTEQLAEDSSLGAPASKIQF